MPSLPFGQAIRQLRIERGLSVEGLVYEVWSTGQRVSTSALKSWEAGDPKRRPSLENMAAVAQALGVDPGQFPEYRLAAMRRALDEREPPQGVGLVRALEHLEELEAGLRAALERSPEEVAARRLGKAASPSARKAPPRKNPRPAKRRGAA